MVATSDVTLPAPRNSGLSADHMFANMVILGPGKIPWMVTHGISASYRWRGWTLGMTHALIISLHMLAKEDDLREAFLHTWAPSSNNFSAEIYFKFSVYI